MPDLFHFNQPLARKAGASIGKAWDKACKAYEAIKSKRATDPEFYYSNYKERQALEYRYLWQENCRRGYRLAIHKIHKAIHAFDEKGNWKTSAAIKKSIQESIAEIEEKLISSKSLKAHGLENIEGLYEVEKDTEEDCLDEKTLSKLNAQIPDILSGIKQWQNWTKERLDQFMDTLNICKDCKNNNLFSQITTAEQLQDFKNYLQTYFLPFLYWQIILQRTPCKSRNQKLRPYYKTQIKNCEKKLQEHSFSKTFTEAQIQICYNWCEQVARSFQRSSSQVEGRNGYLAFIHKANRGLSQQRLKALTVIHNFDIRGLDGKTPAQRLFQKEFPDLFEFVLQNVTPFPEPRKRREKPVFKPLVAP